MSLARGLRAAIVACALGVAAPAQASMCGTQDYPFPFTDVAGVSDAFCEGIMQAFVLGVTRGTSPTTFSPNDNVPRLQMTTFLQRTFDQGPRRASKRAALERWWTARVMPMVEVPGVTRFCASDGQYVYAATETGVTKIEASTGAVQGHWPGMTAGRQVVVMDGVVFVVERTSPGRLYGFESGGPPTTLTLAAGNLGDQPVGMAFDGSRLWTANASGSVSIATLQEPPFPVVTVSAGFSQLIGILYDGVNMWVSDGVAGKVHRLDENGAILQSVTVGSNPGRMVYDGTNLWVVNGASNSVSVIVAATGAVAFTLDQVGPAGGELAGIAFDGERILVADQENHAVALYRAADASRIATIDTGAGSIPYGACSDGMRLWVSSSVEGGSMMRF